MNTLGSWTKEGSFSSSVAFLLLRITPRKKKCNVRKKVDILLITAGVMSDSVHACVCVCVCMHIPSGVLRQTHIRSNQ